MNEDSSYHLPLYQNCYYHIYNRAVGNDKLFFQEKNYSYFLSKFKHYLNNFVEVYSYCLLQNHFHFLIKVIFKEPSLISKQFRRLFISYSMSINKQENRKGNLFIKNFKRRLIKNEGYLRSVIRYIHLNPIHHKVTKDYHNYPYSSFKSILSINETLLKRDEILCWFNGKNSFIEFHEEGKEKINEDFYNFESN